MAPVLLLAVIAISFAAIFFRLAAPTHPLVAAGIRLAVAAVFLFPLVIRSALAGRIKARLFWSAVAAGLLYGLHFGSWVTSLTMTTVAASVTLVTITPFLLALLGVITKKDRPTGRLWSCIALAAVGITLIGGMDALSSRQAALGDALALLGALAMAGYLLVARRLGDELDLWAFSGIATAVGAIALLGPAAILGLPIKAASSEALVYLVLAALVPQLVGHNLLTWSLRHATPATVSMAVVGEPVGATILGWLWLGENVSPVVAVGCLITIIAVGAAVAQKRDTGG